MVVSKRGGQRCDLHIGDVKIKQVQIFNYLVSVVTDDGKFNRNPKLHRNSKRYLLETKSIRMENFVRDEEMSTELLCFV